MKKNAVFSAVSILLIGLCGCTQSEDYLGCDDSMMTQQIDSLDYAVLDSLDEDEYEPMVIGYTCQEIIERRGAELSPERIEALKVRAKFEPYSFVEGTRRVLRLSLAEAEEIGITKEQYDSYVADIEEANASIQELIEEGKTVYITSPERNETVRVKDGKVKVFSTLNSPIKKKSKNCSLRSGAPEVRQGKLSSENGRKAESESFRIHEWHKYVKFECYDVTQGGAKCRRFLIGWYCPKLNWKEQYLNAENGDAYGRFLTMGVHTEVARTQFAADMSGIAFWSITNY